MIILDQLSIISWLIALIIFTTIVVSIGAYLSGNRSILNPHYLEHIANNLDLSTSAAITMNEISQTTISVNKLLTEFKKILIKVKGVTSGVEDSVLILSSSANTSNSNVELLIDR